MERAGSREKINSASLGGLGGKREKNSQRPGRDQLLRCESFRPLAALRARARNTQQHTATDAARQPARAALSPIAALPVALGFAMPAKPEGPNLSVAMAKFTAEWEWFFAAQTGLECSKRFQFSLTAAVMISVFSSSPSSCLPLSRVVMLRLQSPTSRAPMARSSPYRKALNSRSRRSAERFHEANKSSEGPS